MQRYKSIEDILLNVDHVPLTVPLAQGKAKLLVFEDNEAVLKAMIKGRSTKLRHVPRTHRISLDWLYERFRYDISLQLFYVPTKAQIADIFTKGSFSAEQWRRLCSLANIVPNMSTNKP